MITTPIYADEVEQGFSSDGGFSLINERFRATLAWLDPAKDWTLEIYVVPTSSITVAVQGIVQTTTIAQTLRFSLNTSNPVIIDATAPGGARVYPQVVSSAEADSDRFALLAWTVKPEFHNAVLGTAILGSFALPNLTVPTRGTVLGVSVLGATTLEPEPSINTWRNILGSATEIQVTRGVIYNGFTSKADIGTLEVSIFNALDPRSSTLVRGTPLVLIDAHRRRPIMTTTIEKTVSQPDKDGTYTVTITGYDAVAQTAQIKKYQDTRSVGIAWNQAVAGLLGDLAYTITATAGTSPLIGSLVKESTLTEYLDIYTATAGASWFVNKAGGLVFTDSLPREARCYITDSSSNSALPTLSPVDIEAEFDTASVISTLEANNNYATKDANGDYQGATTKIRVENAQNTLAYGQNTQTIETAAVNTTALRDYLAQLLSSYAATQTYRAATFNLIDATGYQPEIDEVLDLEIFDRVTIYYRNSEHDAHITRISLTLTPQSANATLEFMSTKD